MPKALRKRVNRKDKGYHALRRSEINDLDKAASFLLAISYSGRTSQTKASQGLIQMDCVALAVINNEWLVAANSRRLDDWHMEALAQELGFDFTYAIVERGQGGMHARCRFWKRLKPVATRQRAYIWESRSRAVSIASRRLIPCKLCTPNTTQIQWLTGRLRI